MLRGRRAPVPRRRRCPRAARSAAGVGGGTLQRPLPGRVERGARRHAPVEWLEPQRRLHAGHGTRSTALTGTAPSTAVAAAAAGSSVANWTSATTSTPGAGSSPGSRCR
ncbi:hypothetical protein BJF90_39005 [Pseudonocardia sp. CNS-004]|nr:hypothetical protein BJF90_39005 [Pseudonocardia sp. CNS-004]